VPRIPIAKFLLSKLDTMTMTQLSLRLGIDDLRLRSVIYGYTRTQRRRGGPLPGTKLTSVDFILIDTVDAWLTALGEPPDTLERLYPLSEYGSPE
jgi:hypothetical protein